MLQASAAFYINQTHFNLVQLLAMYIRMYIHTPSPSTHFHSTLYNLTPHIQSTPYSSPLTPYVHSPPLPFTSTPFSHHTQSPLLPLTSTPLTLPLYLHPSLSHPHPHPSPLMLTLHKSHSHNHTPHPCTPLNPSLLPHLRRMAVSALDSPQPTLAREQHGRWSRSR